MAAILILNHAAGSVNGDRDAVSPEEIVAAFAEAGQPVALRLAEPAQLRGALEDAVAARPEAIFVAGGDGTMSTAAGVLAGTGIPLGPVPLGTLNHFARDLGLPPDWRAAVPVVAAATPRAVDVGEVNGRVFVNNCSLGSYPEAVRQRDRLRRQAGHGKWRAMALASFRVFRRLRRLRLHIETPETTLALRTPFVFVGNNRYTGHLLAASLRPRLDEEQLCLYTTRAQRHFTLIRLVWQSLLRSLDAVEGLEVYPLKAATISSPTGEPIPVALDGELAELSVPLRFHIRPRALRVLAPRPDPS